MRVGVPYIYWGLGRVSLGGGFQVSSFIFLVDIRKTLRIEIIMISKIVCYNGIIRRVRRIYNLRDK